MLYVHTCTLTYIHKYTGKYATGVFLLTPGCQVGLQRYGSQQRSALWAPGG